MRVESNVRAPSTSRTGIFRVRGFHRLKSAGERGGTSVNGSALRCRARTLFSTNGDRRLPNSSMRTVILRKRPSRRRAVAWRIRHEQRGAGKLSCSAHTGIPGQANEADDDEVEPADGGRLPSKDGRTTQLSAIPGDGTVWSAAGGIRRGVVARRSHGWEPSTRPDPRHRRKPGSEVVEPGAPRNGCVGRT